MNAKQTVLLWLAQGKTVRAQTDGNVLPIKGSTYRMENETRETTPTRPHLPLTELKCYYRFLVTDAWAGQSPITFNTLDGRFVVRDVISSVGS